MAHPYTSFGGSYDDYVVLSVVMEMLEAGFVTGTFNFRYTKSRCSKSHLILINEHIEALDPQRAKPAGQLTPSSRITFRS